MRSALLFALLLPLAGCTSGEDDDRRDPRFDALAAQLDEERIALGAPAVSIALLEDGEVVWAEGFGTRLPGENDPARDTTLYRIGSVTKMLTATSLLRRVDAGQVDLDAPVTDYVPAFHFDEDPSWATAIRVGHLLTHTHGMVDYLAIDGSESDTVLESFLTGNVPSSFGSFAYLMAPPGRMWNYSNPGYYVAGLVNEKVSGASAGPWREILRNEVLLPLGMERTLFLADEVLADGDYATGLSYDWENGTNATLEAGPSSYDNAWARPAGYAWSSVHDLARFAQFLLDGNTAVLSDALRAEMQSGVVDTKTFLDRAFYGYGLSVNDGFELANVWYDVTLVSHGGAIPGFSASLYLIPETRFGLVILASTDGAYFPETLEMALEEFASLPPPLAVPDRQIDPADFPALAGTYLDPWNVGTIVITTTNGEVSISMPALDTAGIPYESELIPLSKDNFVLGVQGFQALATFIHDTAGNAQYFRTRFAVGERQPASFAPPAPVTVDAAKLERSLRSRPFEVPLLR